MPEAIHYCDRCGKIIKPAEIHAGSAFVRDDTGYCASCVAMLPAEQQAALKTSRAARRRSPPLGRPSSSRRMHKASPASAAKKLSPGLILAVSAGVGLVVGLVVVVMATGGGDRHPPASSRTMPATVPPVSPPAPAARPAAVPEPAHTEHVAVSAGEPAVSVAAGRLAAAKELVDSSLNRYDDARSALAAVAREFAGTVQAVEAERLVTEIDAKHAAVADAALKRAIEYASGLVRKAKYDEARSALRAIQARFRGSRWYVASGEAVLVEEIARIARMAKEAEEKRNRPLRPEEVAAGGVAVVNAFETEHDVKMFDIKGDLVELSREHVTHGVTSLKIEAGSYLSGWNIVKYRRDWSGYDALQVDIYNDTGAPVSVSVRVWDESSATGGDDEYWNRHNGSSTLKVGMNVFTLDLTDLYRGESGRRNTVTNRNIDLDKIKRFDLGFKGSQGALYLDTMRLVRAAQ